MNKKRQKIKVKSDLTSKLKSVIKDKRVGVYVDAANLYYAATSMGMYISFESVSNWFKKNCKSVDLNFYTAFDSEDEKQKKFIDELSDYSYRVIKKPVKVFDNLRKGNMDIELAVDALVRSDKYDVLILLSGDGDFNYLLRTVEELGKETIVISVGGFTSYELHQGADNYFFLDRISGVWKGVSDKSQQKRYYIFIDEIGENDYNPDYNYNNKTDYDNEVSLPGKKDAPRQETLQLPQPKPQPQKAKRGKTRIIVRNNFEQKRTSKKVKVKLKVKNPKDPKIYLE